MLGLFDLWLNSESGEQSTPDRRISARRFPVALGVLRALSRSFADQKGVLRGPTRTRMVFTLAPRISIDLVKHRIQARNIPKNRADDPLLSDRERPPQNVNDSSTYLSTTKIPQTSSLGGGWGSQARSKIGAFRQARKFRASPRKVRI